MKLKDKIQQRVKLDSIPFLLQSSYYPKSNFKKNAASIDDLSRKTDLRKGMKKLEARGVEWIQVNKIECIHKDYQIIGLYKDNYVVFEYNCASHWEVDWPYFIDSGDDLDMLIGYPLKNLRDCIMIISKMLDRIDKKEEKNEKID